MEDQKIFNEINKISNRETKILTRRSALISAFFPVSLLVIVLYVKIFMQPLGNDHGATIGANMFITLSLYAIILLTGYGCYLALSKKLDRLSAQKNAFL